MRTLIYALHSGQLFGTERMALATVSGLRDRYRPVLLAPAGPVHEAAAMLGIESRVTHGPSQQAREYWSLLRGQRQAWLMTTGVSQALQAAALAPLARCRLAHIHMVHGGTDERLSYGRKRLLGPLPIKLVAVSRFVRERLLAHGCRDDRIAVIENFVTEPLPSEPQRPQPEQVSYVAVVSRIDPIKRVDLLLSAISREPALHRLQFDLYGSGSDLERLREAVGMMPNVRFMGFVPDAAQRLADYDLLLHTCPEEPFGLAILEAMARHVPVLVPNSGGAGDLVKDELDGFHFAANCPGRLAQRLLEVAELPAARRAEVAEAGFAQLTTRFSSQRGLSAYRDLLEEMTP